MYGGAGQDDFVFRFLGKSRADGNAVWVVKAGDHLIVRADVNGDARADLEIHVAGAPTLFAGDFLL